MDFKNEYRQKLMSAGEAVKLVKSGDNDYVGKVSSTVYHLMDTLGKAR